MNLKLNQTLKKFFFNSKCSVCRKEVEEGEIYLCRECREKIEKKKKLHMRQNIFYLFSYNDDIRKIIIDYKLNGRKGIGNFLGTLIEHELKEIIYKNDIDVVVPVPVSKERFLARGFNQVEEILDSIGISYKKIERRKNTLPMHGISDKNMRKINVKSAFECKFLTRDKNILIIDDIITTGITITEMIKSLEAAGKPKNIFIFAVSAAPMFCKRFFN